MNTLAKLAPNVVVIGLGVAATVTAAGYGFLDEEGRIGPGFLPTIAASLMALFAIVNLITSRTSPGHTVESIIENRIPEIDTHSRTDPLTGSHTSDHVTVHAGAVGAQPDAAHGSDLATVDRSGVAVEEDGMDIHGRTQRQRDRMLWTVVGIVLATVLLVPVLGFMMAFALMLVIVAVAVERRKIIPSLVVSAITLGATYGIFVLFLRVPLPQGFLGI